MIGPSNYYDGLDEYRVIYFESYTKNIYLLL